MQIRYWHLAGLWLALTGAFTGSACGLEVKLTVRDDAKVARRPGMVTSGVPFAKGAMKDVSRLSVSAGGRTIPAQFARIARWEDDSVRWALMDTQVEVPAGGAAELVLRDDGANRPPARPVKVIDAPDGVTISTGPLELTIDKKRFNLFKSLKIDGKEVVGPAGTELVIYKAGGGTVVAGPPQVVRVEQPGPVRAVVMLRGRFGEVHNGLMGYTVRLTAYAGQRFVKLRVWIENHGQHGYAPREKPYKPEWFAFDGIAVEMGLALGERLTAECEGVRAAGRFKVLQICKPLQRKDRYLKVGYRYKDMEYTITSGGKLLKKGPRTDGVVSITGSEGGLTVAVRHFWQNYEKAIELEGNLLNIWLWPLEGQSPRPYWDPGHYCPGYAKGMMLPLVKKGLYNMPGSVHKGYEIIFDFSGRDPKETAAELSRPLFALAPAEYYAATEAAPGLFAPPGVRTDDPECNAKLDAWMRMTRSVADPASSSSIFFARRDRRCDYGTPWSCGFWYGWMDFGDLAVPGSGSVSLHYDWPWVMMVNLMRTGDLNFLRLGTEMVRHRVEIDQQWSDRALPQYRGFQRSGYTYAHFHCARFTRGQPSVTTTWLAGVVLYYMLTGDAKTYECIQRTVKYMPAAWERIFASDDWYTRRIPGDMQAVARTIFTYCSMYDLTGQRHWLDKALMMFRRCVLPKAKNYGPHLHERKQIRSQDYTRDDVKYCYSIQAFCLLHHLTGEKRVLALLKAGCDAEFPENFFDAPLYLADLHAYVALKTANRDYLDDAVDHWISAFPESKCPPVYLPSNSQWSRRKAMMLRAGHLLQYAFWKWPKGK